MLLTCSDCGEQQECSGFDMRSRARTRCVLCGGPLNQRRHTSYANVPPKPCESPPKRKRKPKRNKHTRKPVKSRKKPVRAYGPTYGGDIMEVGRYKGKRLCDIPVRYWIGILQGGNHRKGLIIYASRRVSALSDVPKRKAKPLRGILAHKKPIRVDGDK